MLGSHFTSVFLLTLTYWIFERNPELKNEPLMSLIDLRKPHCIEPSEGAQVFLEMRPWPTAPRPGDRCISHFNLRCLFDLGWHAQGMSLPLAGADGMCRSRYLPQCFFRSCRHW